MTKTRILWILGLFLLCSCPGFAETPLASGDRIHIWVKGEPDLTVDRLIGGDGNVACPLIGSVGVAGLTPREAAKLIGKMLDDGYLRNPLVQIDRIGSSGGVPVPDNAKVVTAEPLRISTENENFDYPVPAETKAPIKPFRVDIVDGRSGEPVSNAALLSGGKIYQGNRLGQMILESSEGQVVLMADGFKVLQGNLEDHLRKGPVNQIAMERVKIAQEISVKVVDYSSNQPLADVQVKLDAMRVKTNSNGVFKIREIKKEFGELQLTKKGFKLIRMVLDFKDQSERVIPMVRDD